MLPPASRRPWSPALLRSGGAGAWVCSQLQVRLCLRLAGLQLWLERSFPGIEVLRNENEGEKVFFKLFQFPG